MNNCHQFNSERDLNAHPSSDHTKRIVRVIAVRLKSLVSDIWNTVSTLASNEPRVWQWRDRFGQIYWQVYDPIRDRTIRCNSEEELRSWLDQRFYTD